MAQGMALVQDLDLDLGVARSGAWQGLTAWPVPPLQLPGTFPAAQKNTRQFLLSGIFLPRERPGRVLRQLNSCAMGLHVRVFVGEAYLGIFKLVQYFHVLI